MALKKRLIARLDIRNHKLIKPRQFEGVRVVGDPAEYAARYDRQGIDEIIYMDAVASLYGRSGLSDILAVTAGNCGTPLIAGGGISSVDDAVRLLRSGADKVAINTAALQRPELITEISNKIGSQSVVLQIDARVNFDKGFWEAYSTGGRLDTGKPAIDWAILGAELGAGEILITSIEHEGLKSCMALGLIRAIAENVNVPVIASGGIGTIEHIAEAFEAGADGVAMAHVLHYDDWDLDYVRYALAGRGFPMRMTA